MEGFIFFPSCSCCCPCGREHSWTSAQTHAELKKQQDKFLKNELGEGKEQGVGEGVKKNQGMSPTPDKGGPYRPDQPQPGPLKVQILVCSAHNPETPVLLSSSVGPTKGLRR